MFFYGKTAANAIAAASYLAQHYGDAPKPVSSAEVAEDRGLSRALAAKLLSQLSQAGIIAGSPGPGGGYYLARPPSAITLLEIVERYEHVGSETLCPFGPNWCGNNNPCPMHEDIVRLRESALQYLESTTLEIFAKSPKTVLA